MPNSILVLEIFKWLKIEIFEPFSIPKEKFIRENKCFRDQVPKVETVNPGIKSKYPWEKFFAKLKSYFEKVTDFV